MTAPASVGAREHLRLFCGLPVPPDAVERLVPWQREHLAGAGRVVEPGNLHVTLAFLGRRPAGDVERVAEALRGAASAAEPPDLAPAGYRETRSVGMLVLDDRGGRAAALADDLHGRLEALGVYERERRPWLPHLTVLRFRERPRLRPPLPDLGVVAPSEAAAYMSVLRPTGAQYEILASASLGGR